MKTIDTYIKEALITKSNIKNAAKANQRSKEFPKLDFDEASEECAEELQEYLEENNLMPTEMPKPRGRNALRGDEKWYVGASDWFYYIGWGCERTMPHIVITIDNDDISLDTVYTNTNIASKKLKQELMDLTTFLRNETKKNYIRL